jgi:uncharacterized protein involved in outer membrane biogenesis
VNFEQLPPARIDLHYTIGRLDGPNLILQDVSLQAGLRDRLPTLALEGGGTFRGEPVTLDVKASPAEGAARPQVPYRIDAEIEAGQSRLTASGGIDQPEHLQGAHLEFEVRSPDTTELLRQLGVEVPELPGLQALGRLIREGEVWRLTGLNAQIGRSATCLASSAPPCRGRGRSSAPTFGPAVSWRRISCRVPRQARAQRRTPKRPQSGGLI